MQTMGSRVNSGSQLQMKGTDEPATGNGNKRSNFHLELRQKKQQTGRNGEFEV
jgi:hypothetical protein